MTLRPSFVLLLPFPAHKLSYYFEKLNEPAIIPPMCCIIVCVWARTCGWVAGWECLCVLLCWERVRREGERGGEREGERGRLLPVKLLLSRSLSLSISLSHPIITTLAHKQHIHTNIHSKPGTLTNTHLIKTRNTHTHTHTHNLYLSLSLSLSRSYTQTHTHTHLIITSPRNMKNRRRDPFFFLRHGAR